MRIVWRFAPDRLLPYDALDQVHDALVHAWAALGATAGEVVGPSAEPWSFGVETVNWRAPRRLASAVHVATVSPRLEPLLARMRAEHIQRRPERGRRIDFAALEPALEPDPAPVAPGTAALPVTMVSPLVIRPQERIRDKKPILDLTAVDLSAAVSAGLSRAARREVRIEVTPDRLYAAGRAHVCASVPVKIRDGQTHRVAGLMVPLLLRGSAADLETAWDAGLGGKTRMGFGCIRAA